MRLILILLMTVLLTTGSQAGPFELEEGSWRGQDSNYGVIRIQVGPEKTFNFDYIAPTRDLRNTSWRGTYRVLAAKDSVHFRWTIKEKKVRGRVGSQYLGVELREGQTVPAMMEYLESGAVVLTLFDDEAQPLGRFELTPEE
jgi:hypothetical protein